MNLGITLKYFFRPLDLLWFSSICLFAGRGIQSIWGSSAVVDFLSYERIVSPVVSIFIPWQYYVTKVYPILAEWVSWGILFIYVLSGIALLNKDKRNYVILAGGILLLAEVILALPGDFLWLSGLAAKTLMWTPVFFYLIYKQQSASWIKGARWAVAAVFISHGLSALNILPVPGSYSDMITILIGWSDGMARLLLLVAGILDILISLSILMFPRKVGILWGYLILWGIITAIARLTSNVSLELDFTDNLIWFAEMLIRLPHGVVPMALYLAYPNKFDSADKEGFS